MKSTRPLLIAIAAVILVGSASVCAYYIKGRLLDPSRLKGLEGKVRDSANSHASGQTEPIDPRPPVTEQVVPKDPEPTLPIPDVVSEPPPAEPPVTPPTEGYGKRGGRGGKDPPPATPP